MIKLRLKRKMSGKAIRKDKRDKELRPTKIYIDSDGNSHIQPVCIRHENQGLYNHNRLQKRHVENPNIYEGDKPLICGINNIRIPRKGRKTAWKRFHKAFPYIKVNKKGQIIYCPEKDKLYS